MEERRYRVGIDVGLYSDGLSAIEIDDSSDNPLDALPIGILSCMSVIHDAGVDPDYAKSADSRKAVSGVARRARRLRKREKQRLAQFDKTLESLGYPALRAEALIAGLEKTNENSTTYMTWNARIQSVRRYIEDESERKLSIAVALRHIARHRGWRNPYSSVLSLNETSQKASPFYEAFFKKVQIWRFEEGYELHPDITVTSNESEEKIVDLPETVCNDPNRPTPAELIEDFLDPNLGVSFRKGFGQESKTDSKLVAMGKLHQSDYYHEALRIFETQKVPEEDRDKIVQALFKQINPREVSAAAELIKGDDLPGQHKYPRASRASIAFQKYRILSTITNLRIYTGDLKRPLSQEEINNVYEYLINRGDEQTTWSDVADVLGIERNYLTGVGGVTQDGDPISAKRPPVLDTILIIAKTSGLPQLSQWWDNASDIEKECFIESIGNVNAKIYGGSTLENQAIDSINSLLQSMTSEELEQLEKISLPAGRVAYSVDSLSRLADRMLEEGCDLHAARKEEFGVDDNWHPSGNKLGTPSGNPAVDRTISIVARWLLACERKWGKPETINIEHVREGFSTPKSQRKNQADMDRRYNANLKIREDIVKALDESEWSGTLSPESIRRSDVRRYQAVQRQNNQCAYCGAQIDVVSAQMEHIVPRKGAGSSNELSNLIATCADCNLSKRNIPFSVWASQINRPNVSVEKVLERVDTWNRDSYFSTSEQFTNYKKEVKNRLLQTTEDEPLDTRSMESVAWMARELVKQIEQHFGYEGVAVFSTEANDDFPLKRVNAYRGSLTAEARRASGIEKRLPWIGGASSKTRLDRRHHAIDASVIALMRPVVGKVLAERKSLRRSELETMNCMRQNYEDFGNRSWRFYTGHGREGECYKNWHDVQMPILADILKRAMEHDDIVVTNRIRLQLGNGRAHEDTITPFLKRKVGDAFTIINIDKAETPALWCALTSCPDFDSEEGLLANPQRRIRVQGKWLEANDTINFLAKNESDFNTVKDAVFIPVRNGFVGAGNSIHHARFYRIPKKGKSGKQTGWAYAYMRVFQADLLKHQNEDLFSVSIPPQSYSRRAAKSTLRKALDEGTAEYLSWAVVGDEVEIDPANELFSSDGDGSINLFMRAFPGTKRFKIIGFMSRDKMKLRPIQFADEGLPSFGSKTDTFSGEQLYEISKVYGSHDWTIEELRKVNTIIENGYQAYIDRLFSTHPTIIRRDVLGNMRMNSDNHMPICWHVMPHPSEE